MIERQAVADKAISEMTKENTVEAPAFINKFSVNGALSDVTQLDTLSSTFNEYLDDMLPHES